MHVTACLFQLVDNYVQPEDHFLIFLQLFFKRTFDSQWTNNYEY